MQKQQLIHNCLTFQYKKQRYIYGMTYCMLTSSYITKHKFDYLIVPSTPFVNHVFTVAGIQMVMEALGDQEGNGIKSNSKQVKGKIQSQLFRIIKYFQNTKIIIANDKSLHKFMPPQLIDDLIQAKKVIKLKQLMQIEQKQIMDALISLQSARQQQTKTNSKSETNNDQQLIRWFNCVSQQLKIIVPQTGMTTYLCQQTDIIVVNPTQQWIQYIKNNRIITNSKIPAPCLINYLHSVFITKVQSIIPVITLLTVAGVGKVRVIVTSKQFEHIIIDNAAKYLGFPEQVTRSRLLIRLIASNNFLDNQRPMRYPVLYRNLNPYTMQSPSCLLCTYYPLSQSSQSKLQFSLGSSTQLKSNKLINFYCPSSNLPNIPWMQFYPQVQLQHFPTEIQRDSLEYLVIYKMCEELNKQMKALPQLLRKKIILNRHQHKYNHKYFVTLQKQICQYCTMIDTQYLSLINKNKIDSKHKQSATKFLFPSMSQVNNSKVDLHYQSQNNIKQLKILDKGKGRGKQWQYQSDNKSLDSKIYQLAHRTQMETIGHVVELVAGVIHVQYLPSNAQQNVLSEQIIGGYQSKGKCYFKVKKITALKYAQVKLTTQSDYLVSNTFSDNPLSTTSQPQPQQQQQQQTLITSPVLPPIILPLLNPLIYDHLSAVQGNSLLNMLTKQQLSKLNKLCKPVTFEVGYKTNNKNQNIYFISKGAVKWEDDDTLANNGCYIGDLISYYQKKISIIQHQGYHFDNYIQVIKDTWALCINIQEFHQYFIMEYPHVLHLIYQRGKIFH